ncbi:hypothetical protein [Puniceicoccus vermicola]|uniref:Uncharacterized protein n=1 Tax=Puniceicoccus vermicola TaxID=388746 RepID=A0A7X1AYF6_9BACT|nr:hypothetical protein [Puniceicoccus vermicola]MBC2602192.1 hypothetical protein [Puniceicoccus vermicola]
MFLLALLTACSTPTTQTSGPATEHRYIPEEDFFRISEYFTGQEPETDRIYVRTDPEVRGGYFWILPITKEMSQRDIGEIHLSVQIPGDPEMKEFTLEPERSASSGATLWIGLTGLDWPGIQFGPVAWNLQILDPEGKVLEERESYLWSVDSPPAATGTQTPANEPS